MKSIPFPQTSTWNHAVIMEKAIEKAAEKLGYDRLKPLQKNIIVSFLSGNDVFVALPTGFGKSLCYGALSPAFDKLHCTQESITIVISPLVAIMKDQCSMFNSKGLKTAYVSSDPGSTEVMKQGVKEGRYQLVFFSPEMLIDQSVWRRTLSSEVYERRLVAVVVDEAHCVKAW